MDARLLLAAFVPLAGCPLLPTDRPVSATHAVLDEAPATFWDQPWPLDTRLDDAGHLVLDGFPNPEGVPFLENYTAFAEATIAGFGTSSPAFLRFDGPIVVPVSNEDTIRASQGCEPPLLIVNVDPDSASYGTCVPLRWEYIDEHVTDPFLASHVLAIAPLWGFPLEAGTTYAALTVDLEGGDGFVEASPTLSALLGGGGEASLRDAYAPLVAHLEDNPAIAGEDALDDEGAFSPRWISHATVWTTQEPTAELRDLAAWVRAHDDHVVWDGDLVTVEEGDPGYHNGFPLFAGSYRAPNFQRGEIPYAEEGGGFEWDAGEPVVQLDERIPLAIGMPQDSFTQPASGWPVLLHAHGTGGSEWSHLGEDALEPAMLASRRGFLSVSIPQPFHSGRWEDGNPTSVDLFSFNYLNPEAGRTTFRQGALDTVSLARLVQRDMAGGGAIALAHPELRIDPDRIYFIGHSQGGLTGSLALPFVPEVKAWVLSGAGGGLGITLMQREDPLVLRDAISTALGNPDGLSLSELHPVLALAQTIVETTDPHNYAPLWVRQSTGEPVSVLLTEGIHDAQTPPDASEALAAAAGLPPADPYRERNVLALDLRDLRATDTPFDGNADHPSGAAVTLGVAQFDADHFAIFREASAATLWANFLQSHAEEGPPGTLGWEP
jgi:hypothetical protein